MKNIYKILIAAVIILIGVQFIRLARNAITGESLNDTSLVMDIPDPVQTILRQSCYDCHSNSTNYPIYANIQPLGWIMASHISKAKEELNFSDFGSYSWRRQISKLDGIANNIQDNIMPLPSYRLMHKKSRLTDNEKGLVISWAQELEAKISSENGN
jgi:hypothetical protein